VRISKEQIRARSKGNPALTFGSERISARGGLELFGRFLRAIELPGRLRQALRGVGLEGDYGAVRMVLVVLALLLVGGVRVTHLALLGVDPIVLRFCGLHRLPSDRSVVRWLKRFTPEALVRLGDLIRDLVYGDVERVGLRRLTLDVDGTVLRTGAKVDGAERGYNPHHPKDRSYYPLTAHVAELGQVLRVWNRPGNVNDSHNADGFLRSVVGELRQRFGRIALDVRLDGAFFVPRLLATVEKLGVGWAIKVPLWKWLGIRDEIALQRRWARVDARIEGFETWISIPRWDQHLRVVVYRKRVFHDTRKNFQLDLFSPDDGTFEYSAVATNKELGVRALWHFMAGRGGHEKTLAELKRNLGFAAIPTRDRMANAAWQMLCVLALNLVRSFQLRLGAVRRPRTWKRTFGFVFESVQTLRFELIHQPARLVRPQGKLELRYAVSEPVRQRIVRIQHRLRSAA
jgi:hypothetical protein